MEQTASPPAIARLRAHRDAVYAAGKAQGDFGKSIDIFPTGITNPRGRHLADALRTHADGGLSRTIETGFALGLSALFTLEVALESSSETDVLHTAIDPFQRSDWNNTGVRMVREAGVLDHLRLLEADSAVVLPSLLAAGESFDAAFVDGSHLFDGVFVDLFYMLRLVRPGGVVVLDDLWMPAVRAALDFFSKNLDLNITTCTCDQGRPKLAVLRVPPAPAKRVWDHYVAFAA